MAKKLPFTYFPLKAIILHFSLFGITLRHMILTEGNALDPTITFFMHGIIGGSSPSERIVAGTIVNTGQTNNLPFSKPNNRVFPFKGAIPLVDTSTGSGTNPTHTSTMVIKNIDKSKVVINKNPLGLGATLEKFLFGRITVIEDEITKGHELGSEVIGKAQGFHLASSLDGSSRTMAFTVLFHDDGEDAINFFGVHRTATHESHIAVVGGTGKYDNAKGYAMIETLHSRQQHTTNGVETLLQITVYRS